MPAWVFPFLFSAFSHQAPSTTASSRSGQLSDTQTPTLPITWGQPGDRDPNPDRDEAVLQLIPTLSTPARRTDAAGPSLSARFLFQFIASHRNPTQTPTAGKLGNFFSSTEETKPFFCATLRFPWPNWGHQGQLLEVPLLHPCPPPPLLEQLVAATGKRKAKWRA